MYAFGDEDPTADAHVDDFTAGDGLEPFGVSGLMADGAVAFFINGGEGVFDAAFRKPEHILYETGR